ncbi:uncharacterized protein si:ch211-194k22.8 [Salmo trutta]|uniref:uncharacterized protein si:ch211-194k22.8 n=1 Tax=Salmo trutta TaxID=8032 RepID=UPI00113141D6|nr:uncharacterized protein LOC115158568 [Salmo trutta]
MRRKSKAKRVLDYESEGDEDGAQKVDHGVQKRRKQMYLDKEKVDENSSSSAGFQKWIRAFELGSPNLYHLRDSNSNTEESEFLQSYSKMKLIAMVICMQREMESLKDQIQCLTACGELSRNLKALIEKTQRWSNEDSKTSVQASRPSLTVGLVSGDAMTPDLLACPTGMNGQWEKRGALPQKLHRHHRDGLFTEFITPELLERCNTGTTAQKLTNDLLRGLYERDCLASHSISGLVYNKRSQTKPALPTEDVQAILRTVQYFFPGKTDAEIKGYIRQKLQNEAKRLRKKPPMLGNMESSFDLPCPRTSIVNMDFVEDQR